MKQFKSGRGYHLKNVLACNKKKRTKREQENGVQE
jgi:hypothetical protein